MQLTLLAASVESEPCAALWVLSVPKRARIDPLAASLATAGSVGPSISLHAFTAFSLTRVRATTGPEVM